MTNIFEQWDKNIDTEGLQKDIEEAANNGGTGEYKEVPHGNYEVAVEQMELKASKKGDPMVSIWFRIVSGEYKNQLLFYNQVVNQGFTIHKANEMLRKLCEEVIVGDVPVIEFKTYKQYGQLIMDIFEAVADNFEYALKYTQNKKNKDFSDFEITEVFVLE